MGLFVAVVAVLLISKTATKSWNNELNAFWLFLSEKHWQLKKKKITNNMAAWPVQDLWECKIRWEKLEESYSLEFSSHFSKVKKLKKKKLKKEVRNPH